MSRTSASGAMPSAEISSKEISSKEIASAKIASAAIVGSGAVGGMIADVLERNGVRVERFDLVAREGVLAGDACAPAGALLAALESVDAVVLALPEAPLLRALPVVASRLRADALLVETASVKQPFESLLADAMGARETVGINPMFAPSVGMRGQPIALVRRRPTPVGDAFLAMLAAEGAHLVALDAAAHDRMAAAMQSLVHASILAFGAALQASGESIEDLLRIAPPPFRALTALAARIVGQSRDTYWDIQSTNADAQRMRALLAGSLARLDAAVAEDRRDVFVELLDGIERHQGGAGDALRQACASMFAALPPRQPPDP